MISAPRMTLLVIRAAAWDASGILGGRITAQPSRARVCVHHGSGERLLDLVGERGSQLSHHADAVDVREVRFQLAESLTLLLGQFAFGHIHYGANVFNKVTGLIKNR